jgi:hypothetical protein
MGRWKDLFTDDKDFRKYYCTDYLKDEDELLFELEYATKKLNIFAIFCGIISDLLTGGIFYFGPREQWFVIGVGKLNIYVLYLGKHFNIPGVDEFKPEYVRIVSLDSIKEINIKRLFIGLICKLSIYAKEEDLVFYLPLKKSEKDYLITMLQMQQNPLK